jgi:hypothetical protein
MMSLLMMTIILALSLGIFRGLGRFFSGIGKGISRMFKPPTPREVLQTRQYSGAFAQEGQRLSQEFEKRYGTPLELVAPVLSALEARLSLPPAPTPPSAPPPIPLATQRLAMLEQSGAMENELQRQAQALQASGFRGGSLARALMGARMGTMMNRGRMMADLSLQEYMLERQREEQAYQRELQAYQTQLHAHQMREQAERERFRLLMGLRSAFQEQAVKGGALTMENIMQSEQLASQQMSAFMQGIGALGSAYAQYRQNQEMLRTLQGMQQNRPPAG